VISEDPDCQKVDADDLSALPHFLSCWDGGRIVSLASNVESDGAVGQFQPIYPYATEALPLDVLKEVRQRLFDVFFLRSAWRRRLSRRACGRPFRIPVASTGQNWPSWPEWGH
jgi:hypothetical protein